MCIFDRQSISAIEITELLIFRKFPDKAKNLTKARRNALRITQWVTSEIVGTPNHKQRVVVLGKFISLCLELLRLRDYEGFINVYLGLRKGSVKKLVTTWGDLREKLLEPFRSLEKQLALSGFTEFFDMCTTSSTPKIPPLGLLMKYITLQQEEPMLYKGSNLINFVKYRGLSHLLFNIHNNDWEAYDLEPNQTLQSYLKSYLPLISEKEISNTIAKLSTKEVKEKTRKKILLSKDESQTRLYIEIFDKWILPLNTANIESFLQQANKISFHSGKDVDELIISPKSYKPPTVLLKYILISFSKGLNIAALNDNSFNHVNHTDDDSSGSDQVESVQSILSVIEELGNEHPFVKLIKACCSKSIIVPVLSWLKSVIFHKYPFTDDECPWNIHVVFTEQNIVVIHQKSLQSKQYDSYYQVEWELQLIFSPTLKRMLHCTFVITDFNISPKMESSKHKKLRKIISPWIEPSFFRSEAQVSRKKVRPPKVRKSQTPPKNKKSKYKLYNRRNSQGDFTKLIHVSNKGSLVKSDS